MPGISSICCQNRHVRLGSKHARPSLFPACSVVQPTAPKRHTASRIACTFDDMQGYPSVEAGVEAPEGEDDTRLPVTVCFRKALGSWQACLLVSFIVSAMLALY